MERHPVFLVSIVIHRAEVQRKYLVGKQALNHKFLSPALICMHCITPRGRQLSHSFLQPALGAFSAFYKLISHAWE